MARLNKHGDVIEIWKSKTSDLRYHLTDRNWLLKTTGPRMGGAKRVSSPKEMSNKFPERKKTDVLMEIIRTNGNFLREKGGLR